MVRPAPRRPAPRGSRRVGVLLGFLYLVSLVSPLGTGTIARAADEAVAIVVGQSSPTTALTLDEVRAIFRLDQQFWPDGSRIVVYLPPSRSVARRVLLEEVYRRSDAGLRKFWIGKLFRGVIPAIPATLRTSRAIVSALRASPASISAMAASQVPEGLRALVIDGHTTTSAGYPLVAGR